MDFCIIDLFEKDSPEINLLQQAFSDAPFSKGTMVIKTPDSTIVHENLSTKNNLEMEKDSVEPGHKYFHHYRKNSYYGKCFDVVKKEIEKNYEVRSHTLMNRSTDFIFSKYLEGGYYNTHVDSQRIDAMRTDYSATLFINKPEDYEGGELCIDIGTHEVQYKLDPGKLLIYPTGVSHRVNKVSSGERHVCVFWIESALQDTRMRKIYRDVDIMINKYLCEPNAAELISKKGFELQHHIMRHFSSYI
jgi:predicted 2-oxoglutarate/Fe(II)-dependent dioxygenase YbiX